VCSTTDFEDLSNWGKRLNGVYQRHKSPQAVIHLSIVLGRLPYGTAKQYPKAKFFAYAAAAPLSANAGQTAAPPQNAANCARI
jgi:hypothetical protein